MRILPDGTVEIRNKRTGVAKIVKPDELPNYGISYEKYAGELEAFKKVGGQTTAEVVAPNDTKEAASLRKEFSAQSKELGFRDLQKAWNKVQGAEKTGAGDLTILYSYIKALDPTSVVREGEINLTKAAESVPSNILRAYQKAKEGKVMSDKLRNEMTREIGMMYNERAQKQQELNAFYTGIAKDSGVDPNQVIGGVGKVDLAKLPAAMPEQRGIEGPVGSILGLAQGATDYVIPETKKLPKVIGDLVERQRQRETSLPDTRGNVGASALKALQNTAGFATDVLPSVAPAAAELALMAGGKEIANAVGKKVGGLTSKIIPKKGAARAAAEALPEPLNTSKIIEAGEKFVGHEPNAGELWKTVRPTIGQQTKGTDLLEKMFDVWKRAYSKSGDVKGNAEAQLYNKLYGAGRQVLNEQAPDVAKEISKLRFLHELPQKAQRSSWFALKAAGLGKLLGL